VHYLVVLRAPQRAGALLTGVTSHFGAEELVRLARRPSTSDEW